MVKVGDKVRIVSVNGGRGGYKEGEVLEVISHNKINPKNIYVRTNKDVGYTGEGSDRPIQQPFTYLIESEYELVENDDKPKFNLGDKVCFTDKFLNIINSDKCNLTKSPFKVIGFWNKQLRISNNILDLMVNEDDIELVKEIMISYSFEEIKEASTIIGQIVASLTSNMWIKFEKLKHNNYNTVIVSNEATEKFHSYDGIVPETHKYNDTVSRLIALCKAFNRDIPYWVYEEKNNV